MPRLQSRKIGHYKADKDGSGIRTESFRYTISLPKKIVEELKWVGSDDITVIKTERGMELVRTQDLV